MARKSEAGRHSGHCNLWIEEQLETVTNELAESNVELFPNAGKGGQRATYNRMRDRKDTEISLDDFEIKELIGKGAFGKVFLVQNEVTKEVFAMKQLRKDVLLDKKMI